MIGSSGRGASLTMIEADLKLPKLPDRTPVKLTISVPPDQNGALLDCASPTLQNSCVEQ